MYRVAVALLDAGASPDVAFSTGAHPLSSAVAACARDLVELLLEVGCSVQSCTRFDPPVAVERSVASGAFNSLPLKRMSK